MSVLGFSVWPFVDIPLHEPLTLKFKKRNVCVPVKYGQRTHMVEAYTDSGHVSIPDPD